MLLGDREPGGRLPTVWPAAEHHHLPSTRPGREVVQVYASRPGSTVERPTHWDIRFHAWAIEEGVFHLAVGRSWGDQRLAVDLFLAGGPARA